MFYDEGIEVVFAVSLKTACRVAFDRRGGRLPYPFAIRFERMPR